MASGTAAAAVTDKAMAANTATSAMEVASTPGAAGMAARTGATRADAASLGAACLGAAAVLRRGVEGAGAGVLAAAGAIGLMTLVGGSTPAAAAANTPATATAVSMPAAAATPAPSAAQAPTAGTGTGTVRIEPPLAQAAEIGTGWDLDGTGVWTIDAGRLVLQKAGVPAGPIRRPAALAILRSDPLGAVTLEADVRSTAALPDQTPRRDLLLVVGYQSPTRFYYVHISAAKDAVHNGIFLVHDADRRRIDTLSDRAVLTDQAWHRVRLEREPASGRIALFVDGGADPIMTASDTTLPAGRVGVGSFDDTGEFRAIRVSGRRP